MTRNNSKRGVCVLLAALAVAMLAIASRIEQPPAHMPVAAPSVASIFSN